MGSPKDPSSGYVVGYCKPPAATRFTKGASGNPSGRPKGRKGVAAILADALSAKVMVNEGGRRRSKSKLEVALTQVVNKAAAGDLKALKQVQSMLPLLESALPKDSVSPDLAADRLLAQKIAARLAQAREDLDTTSTDQGDDHENP